MSFRRRPRDHDPAMRPRAAAVADEQEILDAEALGRVGSGAVEAGAGIGGVAEQRQPRGIARLRAAGRGIVGARVAAGGRVGPGAVGAVRASARWHCRGADVGPSVVLTARAVQVRHVDTAADQALPAPPHASALRPAAQIHLHLRETLPRAGTRVGRRAEQEGALEEAAGILELLRPIWDADDDQRVPAPHLASRKAQQVWAADALQSLDKGAVGAVLPGVERRHDDEMHGVE
mmetsp:Transcript_2923/g.6849  ORF Transcript_2923/g.6849 Transcript_2923/m.6849 type:complete len:234 (-) Transcript_2923:2257-2958(-)